MFKPLKIKPLFTGVVTTANRFVGDVMTDSGLVDVTRKDGDINPFQTVLAVGDAVHDFKEGDIVHINFKRYIKARHVPGMIQDNVQSDKMDAIIEIPLVPFGGKDCMLLQSADIDYVVEEYTGIDEGGLLQ